MTKIDDAAAPFVEAEIKEHQAALIRQMVAVGIIICVIIWWGSINHHDLEICSAAFWQVRERREERSMNMNTFMLLTFVLIFLLGIVTGAWLNAITARSR